MRLVTHGTGRGAWPLLWRVLAVNAGLLGSAFLLLVLTLVTVSAPIASLVEALILFGGLVTILAVDLLLLRGVFRPLEQLVERMRTVDLLRPVQRLPAGGGSVEVRELVDAFNEMIDRLETERRESSRRVLAAQEDERLLISGRLHDSVGQTLTGALLQLRSIGGSSSPAQQAELSETQQTIRQALDEVRRIAHELRPAALTQIGLVSALTELTTSFARQSHIQIVPRLAPDLPQLTPECELTVYRVAQESLANAGRHAHASHIGVVLEHDADRVVLRIADDGHGLEPGANLDRHGGISGMRERAALIDGTLTIEPSPAGGIEVTLAVPIRQERRA